jgi:hypothetical protein
MHQLRPGFGHGPRGHRFADGWGPGGRNHGWYGHQGHFGHGQQMQNDDNGDNGGPDQAPAEPDNKG